jgi:hypothetical protein
VIGRFLLGLVHADQLQIVAHVEDEPVTADLMIFDDVPHLPT